MGCNMRIFWLLTLLAFMAGCSGYRGLPGPNLPGDGMDLEHLRHSP